MRKSNRRNFVKSAGALSSLLVLSPSGIASTTSQKSEIYSMIHFYADGIILSPNEYAKLLTKLTEEKDFRKDNEGKGGVLAELESKFAKLAGKEKAIYMPTGTMANQLAIRAISGEKSKVYVQELSHVFSNESDAAQSLHHKRLMPLAKGKATFSLEELTSNIRDFKRTEIFKTEVGAISIENPVRRAHEEVFDINEIRKISNFAKENDIKMHLDGARLHMASAYSGISIKEYSSYFDTVYLSLYKYFGASAGAMLCGDAALIDKMPHLIKICGGNMASNWPTTAVANYFLEGFEQRYKASKDKASEFFDELIATKKFQVEKFNNGSNVHKLFLKGGNARSFRSNLRTKRGIILPNQERTSGFFPLKVNETILKVNNAQLVEWFLEAAI